MNGDDSWTIHKHGKRLEFVDRGEMVFIKETSSGPLKGEWLQPMVKTKAREFWDKLMREGYRLL